MNTNHNFCSLLIVPPNGLTLLDHLLTGQIHEDTAFKCCEGTDLQKYDCICIIRDVFVGKR